MLVNDLMFLDYVVFSKAHFSNAISSNLKHPILIHFDVEPNVMHI